MEFNYSFNDGPFIEIRSNSPRRFLVEYGEFHLGDLSSPRLLLDVIRPGNTTYGLFREWYTDWYINIYHYNVSEGLVCVSNHIYCDANKNVAIILESDNLHENRIWLDKCLQYKNKHQCKLFVFTRFYPIFKGFSEDNFTVCPEDAYFDDPICTSAYNVDRKEPFNLPDRSSKEFTWNDEKGYYATYKIGRYPIEENGWKRFGAFLQQDQGLVRDHWWRLYQSYRNPIDWKGLTSEEIADHILGLDPRGLDEQLKKLKRYNYLDI